MTESTSSLTSLRRYGIVLRRQWWLVALVTVLALLVSVLYVQRKPSVYAAQMKIVVGQGQALFVPNVSNAVQPFTQTMTDLIQSNVVAAETISRLHLDMTPSALIGHLSVTSPPEASVLQVTYEDTDRPQCQLILATVGQVFTELVDKRLGGSSKTKSSTEAQANGSEPVSATVFDPAHLLPERVAPKTTRTYVIAVVLGLIAAILLAFLRDALTNRIRTEDEAREAYEAPVIGALPPGAIGATPAQVGVMPPKLSARLSESLEVLAATLRFAGGHAEQGIILVTSAQPEEGKSTLTAQISATLAQSGHSAIAVDADLRRAGLGRFFSAEAGMPGLADVLAGESRLADVLIAANQELATRDPALTLRRGATRRAASAAPPLATGADLMYLSAGTREHNPAQVLSLGSCAEVMAQLREIADYIVIDTPPLLLSGDAFPLVQLADIVIVACRERASTRDHAHALSQRLAGLGIKAFSVVLTEASSAQQKTYGYGY